MREKISITNTTKSRLPSLPFGLMKDAVLGASYLLSIAVVGDAVSKKLNKAYRGKNHPTDILSFTLGKKEGELVLNLNVAKKKAKLHERPFENYLGFLIIHGLLHLKGFDHGSTMEREEAKFRKKFGI